MPIRKEKRKPKDSLSLLKKLREQAAQKDSKAICRLVQADLDLGGNADYITAAEGDVNVNLGGEECLVFIIMGSFTLDNDVDETERRGVGHFVYDASSLTLKKGTALVIISGY